MTSSHCHFSFCTFVSFSSLLDLSWTFYISFLDSHFKVLCLRNTTSKIFLCAKNTSKLISNPNFKFITFYEIWKSLPSIFSPYSMNLCQLVLTLKASSYFVALWGCNGLSMLISSSNKSDEWRFPQLTLIIDTPTINITSSFFPKFPGLSLSNP